MEETEIEQKTDEENYFVSMTDMMVGLVFIFIIMLMYYALQLRTQEGAAAIEQTAAQAERVELQLQEQNAQAERQAAELARANAETARTAAETARIAAEAEAARAVTRQLELERLNGVLQGADATRAAILRQIEGDMAAAGVDVEIDTEQGILRLGDQVLFDTADANLTDRGREILLQVAAAFAEVLPCYAEGVPRPETCGTQSYSVEALYIEGHTDNQPIVNAPFADNLALSAERATNTYRFMVDANATLGALCLGRADGTCTPILGVSGYGDRRPIAPNDTPEERALNRRIDFRIIMVTPDLAQLQGDVDRRMGPP